MTKTTKTRTTLVPAAVEGARLFREMESALTEVYADRGRDALSDEQSREWTDALAAAGVDETREIDLTDAHWLQVAQAERRAFAVGFYAGLRIGGAR